MKYDITKPKAPKMPNLGNGTECIKILLSKASKDMLEPLVPILFPLIPISRSSHTHLIPHQKPITFNL